MKILSESTAGRLIALAIEAKDALLMFQTPQIEQLKEKWQSLSDVIRNFSLTQQDISELAQHHQELKHLLELSHLNLALLQKVTFTTSPFALRSRTWRTYPWQH